MTSGWNTRTVTVAVVVGLVAMGMIAFLLSPQERAAVTIKWYSFDEGMALAAKDNKKVLVDVYTDWCVWCKKMDKEVYTDGKVSELINTHFVAVKLNPEEDQVITFDKEHMKGGMFAQAMGVTGYPSTLIFTSDGKPITKIDGFQQTSEFASLLAFIGQDHYKSKSYQEFKSEIN